MGASTFPKKGSQMVPVTLDLVRTPTCATILTGQVVTTCEDGGGEHIGILPDNWESLHLLGSKEEFVIFNHDLMQEVTSRAL